MTELIEKFATLEAKIAAEKGDFYLFALFLREDVPDRWDLLISAPWATPEKQKAVDYVIAKVKAQLGSEDLVYLSRIVVVDPENAAVQSLVRAFHAEHQRIEVRDSDLFGLRVKHAYIITARNPEAPVPR